MGAVTTPFRTAPRRCALAAIPLGFVLLAGCGNGSGDVAKDPVATASSSSPAAAASSSAPADLPACGSIWKAGSKIPHDYQGCLDGATVVKPHKEPCASGQVIVTYDDKFYGVKGGPVNYVPAGLAKSPKYQAAKRSCG